MKDKFCRRYERHQALGMYGMLKGIQDQIERDQRRSKAMEDA